MDFEKLEKAIFQECGLLKDRPVLVGVSGGPDSLCLLHLLHSLGFQVTAAHVNHQLRKEANQEAEIVHQYCVDWKIPFVYHQVDVTAYAKVEKLSIEESARILRYRCLMQTTREIKAQALAVAHQADDQVETVLMHMLRGAGASGLKGMTYRSINSAFSEEVAIVRPLLGVWRKEILEYCQENQITPCYDLTNADTTYFRNRIRRELIPDLNTYNSKADEHIWLLARIVGDEDQYLTRLVSQTLLQIAPQHGPGYFILDRSPFNDLDTVIQRRLVRLIFNDLCINLRDIGFEPVENVISFLKDRSAHGEWQVLENVYLSPLDQERALIFTNQADVTRVWPLIENDQIAEIPFQGEIRLNSFWKIVTTVRKKSEFELRKTADFACFDLDLIKQPLRLLQRKNGERFSPYGMADQSIKLGDFFTNLHYPERVRSQWPILHMGDQVLWIVGLRRSSIASITESTSKILCMELIHEV
jgi:tRNA(Ile)-lysidine synthase